MPSNMKYFIKVYKMLILMCQTFSQSHTQNLRFIIFMVSLDIAHKIQKKILSTFSLPSIYITKNYNMKLSNVWILFFCYLVVLNQSTKCTHLKDSLLLFLLLSFECYTDNNNIKFTHKRYSVNWIKIKYFMLHKILSNQILNVKQIKHIEALLGKNENTRYTCSIWLWLSYQSLAYTI